MAFDNGKPLDLLGSYNQSDPIEMNPEDLVNAYIGIENNAKIMYKTPGLKLEKRIIRNGGGRRIYTSTRYPNL